MELGDYVVMEGRHNEEAEQIAIGMFDTAERPVTAEDFQTLLNLTQRWLHSRGHDSVYCRPIVLEHGESRSYWDRRVDEPFFASVWRIYFDYSQKPRISQMPGFDDWMTCLNGLWKELQSDWDLHRITLEWNEGRFARLTIAVVSYGVFSSEPSPPDEFIREVNDAAKKHIGMNSIFATSFGKYTEDYPIREVWEGLPDEKPWIGTVQFDLTSTGTKIKKNPEQQKRV
ncbi:MAG: hypothetical protein ACFFER_18410 [Candidatus Thorarchaeota archaeon]